jgi:hypothetical protein
MNTASVLAISKLLSDCAILTESSSVRFSPSIRCADVANVIRRSSTSYVRSLGEEVLWYRDFEGFIRFHCP